MLFIACLNFGVIMADNCRISALKFENNNTGEILNPISLFIGNVTGVPLGETPTANRIEIIFPAGADLTDLKVIATVANSAAVVNMPTDWSQPMTIETRNSTSHSLYDVTCKVLKFSSLPLEIISPTPGFWDENTAGWASAGCSVNSGYLQMASENASLALAFIDEPTTLAYTLYQSKSDETSVLNIETSEDTENWTTLLTYKDGENGTAPWALSTDADKNTTLNLLPTTRYVRFVYTTRNNSANVNIGNILVSTEHSSAEQGDTGDDEKQDTLPRKNLTDRVSIQDQLAPASSIIDNKWVAVGIAKDYAISKDPNILCDGQPSYRFELKSEDNSLSGYNEGETKGRAELSCCYATSNDVNNLTQKQINNAIIAKKIYFYGKGHCQQASTMYYRFSVYFPASLSPNVNTIFAQWHGMPDRCILQNPSGEVIRLTDEEFAKLSKTVYFDVDIGYDKISNKPNGWIIEQGGYPPMAFGISSGYFYIQVNSDRKWMSDKNERCNINPATSNIMSFVATEYKKSTLAYKRQWSQLPKNRWITFLIKVKWSEYGKLDETIVSQGLLDVKMSYANDTELINEHIVDNQSVDIGRNDDMGYYFKFGIYRTGSSAVPVAYNLDNYAESCSEDGILTNLSIDENQDKNTIRCYYNSWDKSVNISGFTEGEHIIIYNLYGKEIFVAKSTGKEQKLNVSFLKSGCYIVKSGNWIKKIIIYNS